MTDEPQADAASRALLAKAALDDVLSMTAALFWRTDDPAHVDGLQNGSLFFLDAGFGVFGVTAAHVVRSCFEDENSAAFGGCMIATHERAPCPINLRNRIIDIHDGMDLATLRFSPDEVHAIGRTIVQGDRDNWPPVVPRLEAVLTYCGCPGVGRTLLGPTDLKFGMVVMQGPSASAHETCISIQIAREQLEQIYGTTAMPLNFNFSGMSGGPALTHGRNSPTLRGVIFRGPNPSADPSQAIEGFELISIRPAHFINADGTLDVQRWESNQAW